MPAEPTADATAPAATPVAEAAPSTTPTVPAVTLVEEVTAMPAVEMTEAQAATCVVKVGDTFPQISAATFSGEAKQLAELLGPRLTVVAFWNASNPYAVWELKRVGELIAMPLTDAGVSVVAINCGDPAELAQQTAAASPEKVVQLIDPQRAAFAQVATARLPRVYLLDASGKVLWFDLEYSQETERSLMQAVHFALQGSGG
ncbi:MAG: redoxin domain-containing protein [Pirellulales bacterium]|nr:redoxin domain-containing protein [Pirellulales bacterium]